MNWRNFSSHRPRIVSRQNALGVHGVKRSISAAGPTQGHLLDVDLLYGYMDTQLQIISPLIKSCCNHGPVRHAKSWAEEQKPEIVQSILLAAFFLSPGSAGAEERHLGNLQSVEYNMT